MQAILEACYEYTQIQGIYIRRGDPAAWDKTIADFTRNGAWHDWDLSAIVPANAKGVILITRVSATVVNNSLQFRQNGNANAIVRSRNQTQVANVPLWDNPTVNLDANRIIEYNATAGNWTNLDAAVCAWIF